MNARYFQQNLVAEFGFGNEVKLMTAKVLVVGCGGLGTPVANILNAMGLANLGLVDGDVIEISNLHRQFLYDASNIGLNKATVLAAKLESQNPSGKVKAMDFHISEENAQAVLRDYDIICDCTDNAASRILLDSVCHELRKPLVYAAVRNWEGYVTVLNHKSATRLGAIFAIRDIENTDGCAISGIVPTTCGIVGNMQAVEILKIILGLPGQLDGVIACIDTLTHVLRKFQLHLKVGSNLK